MKLQNKSAISAQYGDGRLLGPDRLAIRICPACRPKKISQGGDFDVRITEYLLVFSAA